MRESSSMSLAFFQSERLKMDGMTISGRAPSGAAWRDIIRDLPVSQLMPFEQTRCVPFSTIIDLKGADAKHSVGRNPMVAGAGAAVAPRNDAKV